MSHCSMKQHSGITVTPAKAGVQNASIILDSRLRGNDGGEVFAMSKWVIARCSHESL
jgi:hypothetical protein